MSKPKINQTKSEQTILNGQNANGKETKDKSPERNFLSDISYIQKASNLFRHSKTNDEPKSNGTNEECHNNGQAKYPIKELASMDIGNIEKIESSNEQQNGTHQSSGQNGFVKTQPSHGAIHRAFNKLKLLF